MVENLVTLSLYCISSTCTLVPDLELGSLHAGCHQTAGKHVHAVVHQGRLRLYQLKQTILVRIFYLYLKTSILILKQRKVVIGMYQTRKDRHWHVEKKERSSLACRKKERSSLACTVANKERSSVACS